MRKILLNVIRHQQIDGSKLNINTKLKVALVDFMCIGNIPFTAAYQAALLFKDT